MNVYTIITSLNILNASYCNYENFDSIFTIKYYKELNNHQNAK